MGSFNNFYSFISNRVGVLPKNNTNEDTQPTTNVAVAVKNDSYSHQRYYSDSNAALLQKEAIQELFPCDNRHSFNPHYQHNLHSSSLNASLPYSTPPSLSSSPTNSSPSSTTSASSRRSSNNKYNYYQQQREQQQQQQQQPHLKRSTSASSSSSTYQSNSRKSYSYNRHQTRRQNQAVRNHANHGQYYEYMDDDMMVGYDNPHQQNHYSNNSNRYSTSMTRVHPQGSSSYTSFSTSTGSDRSSSFTSNGRRTSHIFSFPPSASENERRMSSGVSSVPSIAAAATIAAASPRSSGPALEPISETSVVSSPVIPNSNINNKPTKAQQSLMRIAQCDRRVDSWCTQQAGQWTRHYAETSSCGVMADGRRTRRM
ncbi:hypothetical protein BGZ83_004278 [Gryganskiella cystojenkinii]|nr:hypothetical protein BGZ83_004278 [Gryganskiella cystojenkinii]